MLSLALVSVGLGLNSFMLSRHTDRTMKTILSQIEQLARERSRSPLAEMLVGIIDLADSLSSRKSKSLEREKLSKLSAKDGASESEPHRSRTCNLLIKSQLLCQLS